MYSDESEDFLPSGGSNLATLFGLDKSYKAGGSSSNELTYTPMKQPKKQGTGSKGGGDAPALLVAVTVESQKHVDGKYTPLGKLGCAVLANHSAKDYKLLLYRSQQQHLTTAKIDHNFSLTVQANGYANFYDDHRQAWSLHFGSDDDAVKMAKNIALCKANSSTSWKLIKQDLILGEGSDIAHGDSVDVKYTGWILENQTFGQVFDSNASSDKSLKFKIGKGKVIKGWEEGMIGMCKGGKRLLIISPSLAYGSQGIQGRIPPNSTLIFEVEVKKLKLSKEREEAQTTAVAAAQAPTATSTTTTNTEPPSSSTLEGDTTAGHTIRERTRSLTEQMTADNAAAGSNSSRNEILSRISKMGQPMLPVSTSAALTTQSPVAVAQDPVTTENIIAGYAAQPDVPVGAQHVQQQPLLSHEQLAMSSHTPYSINQSGLTAAPAMSNPFVRQQQPANQIALYQQPHPQNFMQQQPHPFQQQQQPYNNRFPQDNTNMGMGQSFMQQQNQFPGQQGMQQQPPIYQGQQQTGFQGQQQTGFQGQQQMPGYQGQQQPGYQGQQQPSFQGQQLPGQQQFNQYQQQQQPQQNQMGGAVDSAGPQTSSEAKQHHGELKQEVTKISSKMDNLMEKMDKLHRVSEERTNQLAPYSDSHSPKMEAAVLLHNIQRIMQESEHLRKEVFEKSARIEGQNQKIAELLDRNQRYVEQSNVMLEQRSDAFKSTTASSQAKVLELEQYKVQLTTELSAATAQLAAMQLELGNARQLEAELKGQLASVTVEAQSNSQEWDTTRRQLEENREEIENLSSSLKDEKQLRRKYEADLKVLQEESGELREEKDNLERTMSDRKRKFAAEKRRMDEELEEVKQNAEAEITSLRERYRKEKTQTDSTISLQLSRAEQEVEERWQSKADRMVAQAEDRWRRKYDELKEELRESQNQCNQAVAKIDILKSQDVSGQLRTLNEQLITVQSEKGRLTNDLTAAQLKEQQLREELLQAEQRIRIAKDEGYQAGKASVTREVLAQAAPSTAATPPSEKEIESRVKSIMSKVYQELMSKFSGKKQYPVEEIKAIVMTTIRETTVKLFQPVASSSPKEESEEESEDEEETEEEEDEEEESQEEVTVTKEAVVTASAPKERSPAEVTAPQHVEESSSKKDEETEEVTHKETQEETPAIEHTPATTASQDESGSEEIDEEEDDEEDEEEEEESEEEPASTQQPLPLQNDEPAVTDTQETPQAPPTAPVQPEVPSLPDEQATEPAVVTDPPVEPLVVGQESEEESSEEETTDDEEESEEEETDDDVEHSGTESDKAVSMPPDVIAAAAATAEPDISSSPPPTTAPVDHMTTEDTPTDAVDTPNVAVDAPNVAVDAPTDAVDKPNDVVDTPNDVVDTPNVAAEQPTETAKKVGGIFDSMSEDDDFFTPSTVPKSVSKTTVPKKPLTDSYKKDLSASVFDAGEKELSFGDDNSDLFTGTSSAAAKTLPSETPKAATDSKPKRTPNPLFDDDDDDELDWLN